MAKILLVEDEKELSDLCQLFLENEGFEVAVAENGEQAMTIIEQQDYVFDIILSDIMMPIMDGYELCAKVKQSEKGAPIPFLFISSLSTLDEKIKGYAAGGDDYVTKPVAMEEMVYKIKRVLDASTQKTNLRQQINYSNSAALDAITYSADLGLILDFYKNSLQAANFQDLATHLFSSTQQMSLHCVFQIYTPDETLSFSDQGKVSPLESNVIELARKESRFFDFGPRTIINHDNFSLLIKNMPVDKPGRYGTLKDSLGALCNAIEARIKALFANNLEAKKSQILTAIQMAIDESKNTFGAIQLENMRAIEILIDELDSAFISLGLTEQQEEHIRQIGERCKKTTHDAFYKGQGLSEKFDSIKTTLTKILSIKK